MKITSVEPVYTGGGIYCFTGALDDGNYFVANSDMQADWCDVRIVNADPSKADPDSVWQNEWQETHLVKDVDSCEGFIREILEWAIEHKPEGNYQIGDMEYILRYLDERMEEIER